MSPGRTVRPEASMTSVPAGQLWPGVAVVTAPMRPLSIWITASRTGAAPVPSISVPTRTIFVVLVEAATLDRLLDLLALRALVFDHLVREIVLVNVRHVGHGLSADPLRGDQLDVVEPGVGVEAALRGDAAQLTDASGAGIVGGEGEQRLVQPIHRLV